MKKDISKYLRLYLVIGRSACKYKDLFEVLEDAIKGGVTLVQLREKNIDARDFVYLGKEVKRFLKKYDIPLIINDRVDVALAVAADGVHVGQEDIHPSDVRRIVGKDFIIGLSVNSMEHAREANSLDVDYVGVGPVYPTSTKENPKPTLHIVGLKKLLNILKKPAVGIGGINSSNCKEVILAGAKGVAVVSAICGAKSPYEQAYNIRQKIDKILKEYQLKNSYKGK